MEKKRALISGLLLATLMLSACGGKDSTVESTGSPTSGSSMSPATNTPSQAPNSHSSSPTSSESKETTNPSPIPSQKPKKSSKHEAQPIPKPIPSHPTTKPTTKPKPPIVSEPDSPSKPVTKEVEFSLYVMQNLNVRTGPGVNYDSIDTLPKGELIAVDGTSGVWNRIRGSDRWVSGKFLSENNPLVEKSPRPNPNTAAENKFEAQVRTVLNRYGCSTAGIHVDDSRLSDGSGGKADWYANDILIRSDTPADRLLYVAAHECMHLRQYDAYNGDVDKLAKNMNTVYGGSGYEGLEQNADCMTKSVGISAYFYTDQCSGNRKDAATEILSGNIIQ